MRKIKKAIHDDIEYENSIEIRSAINKIDIPSERGLIMKNKFIERDVIKRRITKDNIFIIKRVALFR